MQTATQWCSHDGVEPKERRPPPPPPPADKDGNISEYHILFEQYLADHDIYGPKHRRALEPKNFGQIQEYIHAHRADPRPSIKEFQLFTTANASVSTETDVMSRVVLILCGDANIPNQQGCQFTFDLINNVQTNNPVPDLFDGAHLEDLSEKLRDQAEVRTKIIPTDHARTLVAPYFFLEVKGPDGNASFLDLQARYYGSYGARAMCILRSFNKTAPTFDDCAYAYSATYHWSECKLMIYVHHARKSLEDGDIEYHTTRLSGCLLEDDQRSFQHGVSMFRATRELASRQRQNLIALANSEGQSAGLTDGEDTVSELSTTAEGNAGDGK